MNNKQKIILYITAAVVALMVLFPPYVLRGDENIVYRSGYAFLLALPIKGTVYATMDIGVLLTQIFAVLVIGGLLLLAAKDK